MADALTHHYKTTAGSPPSRHRLEPLRRRETRSACEPPRAGSPDELPIVEPHQPELLGGAPIDPLRIVLIDEIGKIQIRMAAVPPAARTTSACAERTPASWRCRRWVASA